VHFHSVNVASINKSRSQPISKLTRIFYFHFLSPYSLTQQGLLIIEAWRSHSVRHTTFCRSSLDECSARCRNLYLTKYNTYKRQIFIPPVEFEPAIPASEGPQTHALNRTTTGIGFF